MGTGFLVQRGGSGGLGGLDLTIVGGTTRPAKPTQNMIWVNTDKEITSYAFSATQPDAPVAGMVWITIGDSGKIKIPSPVGKDWITVYPLSVKQYVSGAWVYKTAMSYQNGEWDGFKVYFYSNGNRYVSVTGGWTSNGLYWGSNVAAKINTPIFNEKSISIARNGADPGAIVTTNNIDLSKISTLYLRYSFTGTNDAGSLFGVTLNNDVAYDSSGKNMPASVLIYAATNGIASVKVDGVSTGRIFVTNCSPSYLPIEIYEIWGE